MLYKSNRDCISLRNTTPACIKPNKVRYYILSSIASRYSNIKLSNDK